MLPPMRFAAILSLVFVASSGCMTPRSFALQTMAAPLGRGATEVGVMGGVGYASQTNPPVAGVDGTEPVTNQVQNRGFALPGAEANVQHGFNDHVALNLHASSAGIQPGVKITVNTSRIAHFALLPAIALGYASFGSSTFQSRADGRLVEANPTSTTSFSLMAGLKMLVSHRSGVYGGVGYDLMLHRVLTTSAPSASVDRTEFTTVTVSHQISVAIGFDVAFGRVHLRPEIAAAVYPGISQTFNTRVGVTNTDVGVTGGFGWAILPGLGIAVASDPVAEVTEETAKPDDEEDDAKTPKRRRGDEDEDEFGTKKKPDPDE